MTWLASLATVGCYAPEAIDCAVPCRAGDPCLDGQVCGADGWCAAAEIAGSCAGRHAGDGGLVEVDAMSGAPDTMSGAPDAAPSLDAAVPDAAPAWTTLQLVVEGKGRLLAGVFACDGSPNHPGTCSFDVLSGTTALILPVATNPHWRFDGWTTPACAGAAGTCTVTVPAAGVVVGARFVDDHDLAGGVP